MALSPEPVYTAGTARGAKLASLLVDEGTKLVRNIFEQEVQKMNPPSLRDQLQKHKEHLCGLRFLNPGQRKTLYPHGGDIPDSAERFDISLLELLLKQLCLNAPYAGPRDRLRQFRNSHYGHTPSTDLSEEEFERLWAELTDILVDLGGNRDKISEKRSRSIDPEQEAIHLEHLDLLQRLYKEEHEVKDILEKQEERQKKRHEELKSLLEQRRDSQSSSPGTDPEQSAGSDVTEDVIACLKELYGTEYAHVRPLPWCEDLSLHLEQVYTNLRLQVKDDKGRFEDTDTIVSLADIYNTSQGNAYVKDTAIRKIRVEGDPGIGKSCSCQKLAYDWSSGKLGMFKAVFFLEMRHLLAGTVKDAIFEQLLPKDIKITPDQLWSYIQENQDDVLFILDGLDELSQAARESTDVVDLIQGKILRKCHVLVTSRPYHCVKDLVKCHQFYKILGYGKQHSIEFTHKYFCKSPKPDIGLLLKVQLMCNSNSNLLEIAVNPLNNVLICIVWEDNDGKLPHSKAELYEMIVYSVGKRFCTKRGLPLESDKFPPEIKEALRGLGKLSWEGLEQEQLQFNIDEIRKKYDTSADIMLNLGLLTRDYSFSRIKRTCYCAFLHKTFQEYMAAYYISELAIDEGSRNEAMKCLRSLFGMAEATAIDKESMLASCRKYSEVQNAALHLIRGENAGPLFDMFAEELKKAGKNAEKDLLSFLCIMLLGKTHAGDKMAEIVVPYLPQHITNNVGDLSIEHEGHSNWIEGLAHVLTAQKKLTVSHSNPRFVQKLTVNCDHYIRICADSSQKFDMLENTLSDYDKMCSVTLLQNLPVIMVKLITESGSTDMESDSESESQSLSSQELSDAEAPEIKYDRCSSTFSPLRTFIPKCGTESVSIHMDFYCSSPLSLVSSLQELSKAPMIKHVRITAGRQASEGDYRLALDKLLAQMIAGQRCLRSLKLTMFEWPRNDPESWGYGKLTATLQRISEHPSLEVVEFTLPRNAAIKTHNVYSRFIDGMMWMVKSQHKACDVEPIVHDLTECIHKNKLLKTLRIKWREVKPCASITNFYYGVCSAESLSNLCSAIQSNRTLETLEIDGFLSRSKIKAKIVAKLKRNKPRNYKQLRIAMVDKPDVEIEQW